MIIIIKFTFHNHIRFFIDKIYIFIMNSPIKRHELYRNKIYQRLDLPNNNPIIFQGLQKQKPLQSKQHKTQSIRHSKKKYQNCFMELTEYNQSLMNTIQIPSSVYLKQRAKFANRAKIYEKTSLNKANQDYLKLKSHQNQYCQSNRQKLTKKISNVETKIFEKSWTQRVTKKNNKSFKSDNDISKTMINHQISSLNSNNLYKKLKMNTITTPYISNRLNKKMDKSNQKYSSGFREQMINFTDSKPLHQFTDRKTKTSHFCRNSKPKKMMHETKTKLADALRFKNKQIRPWSGKNNKYIFQDQF